MANNTFSSDEESREDFQSIRENILSSSTVRRVNELDKLGTKLHHSENPSTLSTALLDLLFATHSLYNDVPSRKAAERCVAEITAQDYVSDNVTNLILKIIQESEKQRIAPGSALTLVRWTCRILEAATEDKRLWDLWRARLLHGLVYGTNLLLESNGKKSIVAAALRICRRALRVVLTSSNGQSKIRDCVDDLCNSQARYDARSVPLLGVLARVCSSNPDGHGAVISKKDDILQYYFKHILASRVQLSAYLADALQPFFSHFVTMEDVNDHVAPAVEKGLLRAPEVLLNDLLSPLFSAFPSKFDLSGVLESKLLKPLLSATKSTNVSIRTGAVRTFGVIASRCSSPSQTQAIVDELLGPLKNGKITSPEQRSIHAEMLSSLSDVSDIDHQQVVLGLIAVVTKESNENSAAAEIHALASHLSIMFKTGIKTEPNIFNAFVKGLADKKMSIRRAWCLQLAEVVWTASAASQLGQTAADLLSECVPRLIDNFNEVLANPVPSVANGQVVIAYIAMGLCLCEASQSSSLKDNALIKKAAFAKAVIMSANKTSPLLSVKVYSKLTNHEDMKWFIRGLSVMFKGVTDEPDTIATQWAQSLIFAAVSSTFVPAARKEAFSIIRDLHIRHGRLLSKIMVAGIMQWCADAESETRESAASASRTLKTELRDVVKAMHIMPLSNLRHTKSTNSSSADEMIDLLVPCHPQLIPRAPWVDICLRSGADPGQIATQQPQHCLQTIIATTESALWKDHPSFHSAAYSAAADLAFVAPDAMTTIILGRIEQDLDPQQLAGVGQTEVAIYRMPEGTAYIDVLSKQSSTPLIHKNNKDYDTLKWEADLRARIAQKKGQTKKLTQDEQAKVNAQLAKESEIRATIAITEAKLRRGIGIVGALATGPPTEAQTWFAPAVKLLLDVIQAGASLIVGEQASRGYLECSDKLAARLGPIRTFIGVATLRAVGITSLPSDLTQEPLGDLVTRVLYRLHSLSQQRPFDSITLSYVLALLFLVIERGGIDRSQSEGKDEQIVLAVEILAFHADSWQTVSLPRQKLLQVLINGMQVYTQHFRLFKDCFAEVCRSVAPTISRDELRTLVSGIIVPDATVRNAVLQAITDDVDLSDATFEIKVWLARYDDDNENREIAHEIWEENGFDVINEAAASCIPFLTAKDGHLRRAAARALAASIHAHADQFSVVFTRLQALYIDAAKPKKPELDRYGMPLKKDLSDEWEARHGYALALKELAPAFPPDELASLIEFVTEKGPFCDANQSVRDTMLEAATSIISLRAGERVEILMKTLETTLEAPSNSQSQDLVKEASIIIYGALARHLPEGDARTPNVVYRLLDTLSTPSESVQYAVAQCLPPLVKMSKSSATEYLQKTLDEALHSKKYAARRGAAYGVAGIVKGRGVALLKENRVLSALRSASENKKDVSERQGAFLAIELLSLLLGRIFEPYVIQIVPQLLTGFGDSSADVREACLDAAKTCFSSLSSYGVKQILPTLLEGLDEQQWRSKKGACDLLGVMAYLDPQQLAVSLPEIIPPLTEVLNDSHKEVRASANRSLQRFGEVISNPEVKSQVSILLKALSDPTKYTDDALDALIKVNFIHYLDAPSLALVVRILERGLDDRSATKRKAAHIIGSLAHLTERKDMIVHLPILVAGLRTAIVDPVPTTRATASKALGSTIEKLGEDAMPDLIPSLMTTLKSDTGAGDRLGSAQALSEVLAGLGTSRLEDTLPTILQNVTSSKASVREGFMSLFIFLPACFGNSFANYLGKIIPPILAGLADEVESIRETALRAGRLLVKSFASRSVDLLLPELERGLADDSYRIRLSSVELVGDLLFNLTGISGKAEAEDAEENAIEAGQSLLEVLGEEKRNRVLSALYICRCDTAGLVRTSAMAVWKALVSSPRTLRELVPTLTQLLIRRLASSNMEQKVIAGNALGELIRKAGEGVLSTLLPTLEEGLQTSTDTDSKQGICIALRELITAATPESLEDHEKTLIAVVRTALVDSDDDVREAAAEAFDALQKIFGKRAVDQVLPHLLTLLRSEDEAENALAALLTLLTETTRSNIILPNLLPTLLTSPITAFNARALASLAEVASSAMTRRLPNILNALMDNIIACKDDALRQELGDAFDTVITSVDEYDGLNTMMSVMLSLARHDDHRRRARADQHLAKFFDNTDIDFSRYYPDLIRALLIAFDDRDAGVVKAAWTALNALTQHLKKEEMEALVISTRQTLNQVGVVGHNLPGFSLPKGINAILPILLQGLMNGSAEQRTQAALAISDLIDRTGPDGLKPFVTQITGPLIRVVSERSTELKAAILLTLNNLLEKIPTFLKPFLPQLQRTFAKSLADPSSDVLRTRAAKALGTLITMTPRVDPLIAELVTGSKTTDTGVRNAMLKALYEVVSKAGSNMNDASKSSILGLIDAESGDNDAMLNITLARLLGALIKVLPQEAAANLIKARLFVPSVTPAAVLGLNAVLLEAPEILTSPTFDDATKSAIVQWINHSDPFVSDNAVLAAGKYFLVESSNKGYDATRAVFVALADALPSSRAIDTRRLSLVVLRTIARQHNDLVRSHLSIIVLPIFRSVRDPVIPIKLAAEAAFLAVFDVVEEESAVFDKYMSGPGAELNAGEKRSIQEYFKRIALRLSNQARERKEAEGGQGGLGLSSDEVDDEREVWSVGRVDLGESNEFV